MLLSGALCNRLRVKGRTGATIIADAGPSTCFAWEEFFQGKITNAHTHKNYIHAVSNSLDCAEAKHVALIDITPGAVAQYFQEMDVAVPTK